jgi:serine/threonine protein kinase
LNKIKIGDLGIATTTGTISKANTKAGAPHYVSPEIASNEPHNQKTDVWSAGIVLFETILLERPFMSTTAYNLYKDIIETEINFSRLPEDKLEIRAIKPIVKL